jgi:hypothetical protein
MIFLLAAFIAVLGRMRPAGRGLDKPGLDSRLTDGGEVVSPTHWPHSAPKKHYLVLISVRG